MRFVHFCLPGLALLAARAQPTTQATRPVVRIMASYALLGADGLDTARFTRSFIAALEADSLVRVWRPAPPGPAGRGATRPQPAQFIVALKVVGNGQAVSLAARGLSVATGEAAVEYGATARSADSAVIVLRGLAKRIAERLARDGGPPPRS